MVDREKRLRVSAVIADIRECTVGELVRCTGLTKEDVAAVLAELVEGRFVDEVVISGRKNRYRVSVGDQLKRLLQYALQYSEEAPE